MIFYYESIRPNYLKTINRYSPDRMRQCDYCFRIMIEWYRNYNNEGFLLVQFSGVLTQYLSCSLCVICSSLLDSNCPNKSLAIWLLKVTCNGFCMITSSYIWLWPFARTGIVVTLSMLFSQEIVDLLYYPLLIII